ncbi:GNAT family N-acetyltransferase [Sporosarcina sp. USHLN248]|uniref:GNAT family N-acetyltransferase n=1 Tax=Sporosarcina sp. USHLN248 TaxID=3081300 RepID=UPI003018E9BF
MKIIRLKPEHASDYYQLRIEALQNSPEAFASSYEEEVAQSAAKYETRFGMDDSYTFGALQDGCLVGSVTLLREQVKKLSHRVNIVAMYVKPEYRGVGIAAALMEKAIQAARQIDEVEQIHLTVVTTNVPAVKMYEKNEFTTYGTVKRSLKLGPNYVDELLMVCFL